MSIKPYEKLGAFYLGRAFDLESQETSPAPLLYDSKDLCTHAVCVGMTGSGKTGLCVALLEEAAIDGIPALVIDPKGDLGNLLLQFPDLQAKDFRPWIDTGAAARTGTDPDDYAAQQAELWKNGLSEWDQDGSRIRRFQEAAEISIYTPGSEAGLPISILSSFAAPSRQILEDRDLLLERVGTTASSLLGLLGIDADPLRSREHILLSHILTTEWSQGENLDLAALITRIQDPGIDRIGVLALDTFYPAKDRFELAMALNNLLAAPGFQTWLEGAPLDIGSLLWDQNGRPRIAIMSISHLSDSERMFFVSLLLNQTLSWMRGCSGTSTLRALLYMDEVYGYLPPVANPPSKVPLLTMLKQARAFGLGLVLATQNPVDLDYKALSNIGTWFLGRLQTDRDKQRVLDGLEGASAGSLSRGEVDRVLSALGKRTFLLHNVHESAPEVFRVRWVLSYLRGPLTRQQIKRLMADSPAATPAAPPLPVTAVASDSTRSRRPTLPPSIAERFLPLRRMPTQSIIYRPHALAVARVRFVDAKRSVDEAEDLTLCAALGDKTEGTEWTPFDVPPSDLLAEPELETCRWAELPDRAADTTTYTRWRKAAADELYRSRRFPLWSCPALNLTSHPGESEGEFRIRLRESAHELRDTEITKLRKTYAAKIKSSEDRVVRASAAMEKEKQQSSQQRMNTVMDIGTSLLGALFGRKTLSVTNLGRARSAARGFGRSVKEGRDVEVAESKLERERERLLVLEQELELELEELGNDLERRCDEIETFEVKPRRSDIEIRLVALAWAPYEETPDGFAELAWA